MVKEDGLSPATWQAYQGYGMDIPAYMNYVLYFQEEKLPHPNLDLTDYWFLTVLFLRLMYLKNKKINNQTSKYK